MRYPGECRGRTHSEIRDHRGGLPARTHTKKSSLIKGSGVRVIQQGKVVLVLRLSRLCRPIRAGRLFENTCSSKHRQRACTEPYVAQSPA